MVEAAAAAARVDTTEDTTVQRWRLTSLALLLVSAFVILSTFDVDNPDPGRTVGPRIYDLEKPAEPADFFGTASEAANENVFRDGFVNIHWLERWILETTVGEIPTDLGAEERWALRKLLVLFVCMLPFTFFLCLQGVCRAFFYEVWEVKKEVEAVRQDVLTARLNRYAQNNHRKKKKK